MEKVLVAKARAGVTHLEGGLNAEASEGAPKGVTGGRTGKGIVPGFVDIGKAVLEPPPQLKRPLGKHR